MPESIEWVKKAAENGYWEAQNFLAVAYIFGMKGVIKRDWVLALKWLTLGNEARPKFTVRMHARFIKLFMSRKRIEEAERLVGQWKDHHSKTSRAQNAQQSKP